MKRLLLYIIIGMALTASAAKPVDCKSVCRVVAFSQAGDTLATAYGFYISADGEAVLPYMVMKGAARAETIDWRGEHHEVKSILGAHATADLMRVKCEGKKLAFLPIAASLVELHQPLLQPFYSTSKKAVPDTCSVSAVSPFGEHQYMNITTANRVQYFGCPVLNLQGEVVGVVQQNFDKKAEGACAMGAQSIAGLSFTASSAMDNDLRRIGIPRALPPTEQEAYNYLYLLNRVSRDSAQYVYASQAFAQQYPLNVKGFIETATFWSDHNDFARADKAIQSALALKNQEEDVRSAYSDIIYRKVLYNPSVEYPDWTLERALEESERAYALRPDTSYILQKANCLFGLGRYSEAHDNFLIVAQGSKQPAEFYLYAADALERAQGEPAAVVALLDSAIATFSRPYDAGVANYLMARAQRLDAMGKYREAVQDYNDYEKAVGVKNLKARFYEIRQDVEQRARMYQQAIDDLHTAITLAESKAQRGQYYVEIAYIYLMTGLFDDCIATARQSLEYLPDNSEAYKAIGVAYGEKQQKAEAMENLNRALSLGDSGVKEIIEQYNK